ncbi:hypothetical protein EJ04DRAFT_511138 [Polyplosphaeria fusca]|uniref:HD domain-containing protein n=1 Tax=Polyplosphaeria fusca TaxID=682080 RepID=A0A9P4V1G0_9PLEO|nr:hypothetical protein EJ04DRAFT_511138 [Polyplosphaeria fusca]
MSTRILAGIRVPDTSLISKILAYAREVMDDGGYKHVMRSWLIGSAIISHMASDMQQAIDLEVFAASTVLHDLGWMIENPLLSSPDKCFEVDGANGAREFLLKQGEKGHWDKHRLQLVWDAIALHTHPTVFAYKEPEVALAGAAIFTELMGVKVAQGAMGESVITITEQEFDGIAEEFPREGLKTHITGVLCGICKKKPQTTYSNFVGEVGEKYLDGYSREGMRFVDMLDKYVPE